MQLEKGPPVEVPKVISDQQVQAYIETGYLIVPDLIQEHEIEEMRQDVIKVARGQYPNENEELFPGEMSDEEVLENILCIHQLHFVSPVIEKYVRHAKLCGALSQITGAHLPWWDGSVKCMQSMYFVKPPGFQGQAWHQDEIYIPTRDRSLIGAWIALDDATTENGCLWVIPGSHKTGMLYPQREHNNNDEFDFTLESYGFDESDEVPVEVKTGSSVFFNGYLLHRSRKNRGNTTRRVLVNHYCNAWSLLPWQLKEGERASTADHRAVIQVSGSDPYAWKGYDKPPARVGLRQCKAVQEKQQENKGGQNQ
ncbi:MAG: phytanoyl-CoA dioxygenase family protein [Planctomycetota bacterium]|jgi:ectoine hydroxylase-related dioxygenase (phytanoyl-CoA dioxygenase family)|nr:phytanoyl-CoA dioxygenase family protein [Planctomycetota bacterium]MDP7254212.1 phytanoyl-CoA dioxygenase family protein [Planctomycetota bacterium]